MYSDQLSVMTHSDEHTLGETQTGTRTQCNFCIMVSNVTLSGVCVSTRRHGGKSEWFFLPYSTCDVIQTCPGGRLKPNLTSDPTLLRFVQTLLVPGTQAWS